VVSTRAAWRLDRRLEHGRGLWRQSCFLPVKRVDVQRYRSNPRRLRPCTAGPAGRNRELDAGTETESQQSSNCSPVTGIAQPRSTEPTSWRGSSSNSVLRCKIVSHPPISRRTPLALFFRLGVPRLIANPFRNVFEFFYARLTTYVPQAADCHRARKFRRSQLRCSQTTYRRTVNARENDLIDMRASGVFAAGRISFWNRRASEWQTKAESCRPRLWSHPVVDCFKPKRWHADASERAPRNTLRLRRCFWIPAQRWT
jgi:hypothetical protein